MLPAQSEDYSDRQTQLSSNWFAQNNTIRWKRIVSRRSKFAVTSRVGQVRGRRSDRREGGADDLPRRSQRDRHVESLHGRNSDRGHDPWHGLNSYEQVCNLQDSRQSLARCVRLRQSLRGDANDHHASNPRDRRAVRLCGHNLGHAGGCGLWCSCSFFFLRLG